MWWILSNRSIFFNRTKILAATLHGHIWCHRWMLPSHHVVSLLFSVLQIHYILLKLIISIHKKRVGLFCLRCFRLFVFRNDIICLPIAGHASWLKLLLDRLRLRRISNPEAIAFETVFILIILLVAVKAVICGIVDVIEFNLKFLCR